ncbi:hypothetical protein VOLCADRAFT_89945 [Volvox carteri f. nagariensis]|uniref:DUF7906 domain-containing protein n=1 Tax=Volvox carteri f. nagariensis TaxID=3068 RepID=D8TT29_VOLCA|nr:uncharacterized protein VOLCADRAFT_89945 [Volvox carteri f. nagariensis]EFJ49585.1 hypothetical protein VOLCADRAFT_89945 [Volvox carteri f. nagariensis]|eukprot:XP_002949566.1 hypothetical protein VOLCADRAFT_89945 [Volvox carteri f. nagariensis]
MTTAKCLLQGRREYVSGVGLELREVGPNEAATPKRRGLNLFHAEFLGSANLAEYLGLFPVDSLHLPIPLNVVLVGFHGDGNAGVNITTWELNDWFSHLDHVLPHTRIDRSELTCEEDGQCAGLVHGRFHPTPMPSYVHLNFTCNVVLIKRTDVVDTFERAISVFSRPVDPAVTTGMQQVDAHKMEVLVDHFVTALGLENSYSLVVLNPNWHADEPVYGYRLGISSQEMQAVKGNNDRLRRTMAAHTTAEPALPSRFRGGWGGHHYSWPHGRVVAPKFSEVDSTAESERWVSVVGSYLGEEEHLRRRLLEAAGGERGAGAFVHVARLLNRPGSTMGALLRKELVESWADAAEALHSSFHSAHPAEDCLVNTWVGSSGRWVLLDLTAGGKDWGPALGGDGVVHHQTLPRVHELFGGVKRLKNQVREDARIHGTAEQMVSDSLSQAKSARLPSVANRHHHAFLLKRQAARRQAMEPGSKPVDPAAEEEEERMWRAQHQMVLLQAELDLLEEWAMRYCYNNANPPLVCGTWKEEALELRAGLSKLQASTSAAAVYELFREHRWDIFGAEQDLGELHPELWDEEEISKDMLLSELAGALSRAIRHVIAPPTVSWHGRRVALLPEETVNFHIVVLSDNSRFLQTSNPHTAAFDVDGFKVAVDDLRLPNQVFQFFVSRVNLLDEPALAAGMAAAMRTTLHDIPSSEDFFEAEMERVFVDSRELAATLRRHFPPTKQQLHRQQAESSTRKISLTAQTRDVPVYVLQLERDAAVLLDEHYNARALEDMILVVSNSARRDEHPTGMMCGGMLVARPISALKEALAATLLHLGGVLPPHLGYNPRSHTVTHDWLWSVGGHPLSFTSTGQQYTVMQRDALARSYLLDALDTSVDAVNAAIVQLAKAKPSTKLFKHVKEHHAGVRSLLRAYGDVVSTWRSAAAVAYMLDFTTALEYLRTLESQVHTVAEHAYAVAHMADPVHCSEQVVDSVGLLVPVTYLGSAVLAVLSLLWAVLPRLTFRKAKAS